MQIAQSPYVIEPAETCLKTDEVTPKLTADNSISYRWEDIYIPTFVRDKLMQEEVDSKLYSVVTRCRTLNGCMLLLEQLVNTGESDDKFFRMIDEMGLELLIDTKLVQKDYNDKPYIFYHTGHHELNRIMFVTRALNEIINRDIGRFPTRKKLSEELVSFYSKTLTLRADLAKYKTAGVGCIHD